MSNGNCKIDFFPSYIFILPKMMVLIKLTGRTIPREASNFKKDSM